MDYIDLVADIENIIMWYNYTRINLVYFAIQWAAFFTTMIQNDKCFFTFILLL